MYPAEALWRATLGKCKPQSPFVTMVRCYELPDCNPLRSSVDGQHDSREPGNTFEAGIEAQLH